MAVLTNPPRFTPAEYLALEAVAETKHEYIGGDIIAMAGAEPEHNQVVQNARTILANALADRPCRITGSDQRVLVEAVGDYFYPDVVVTCGEPRYVDPKPRSLVNPEIIAEVQSGTTERRDRGEKWDSYRSIPSLTDYVLIASTKRAVDHYHRLPDGTWTLRTITQTGSCTLGNGVVLDLDALYRLV
jgi:Uma2 family endonuclease